MSVAPARRVFLSLRLWPLYGFLSPSHDGTAVSVPGMSAPPTLPNARVGLPLNLAWAYTISTGSSIEYTHAQCSRVTSTWLEVWLHLHAIYVVKQELPSL